MSNCSIFLKEQGAAGRAGEIRMSGFQKMQRWTSFPKPGDTRLRKAQFLDGFILLRNMVSIIRILQD